MLVKDQEYLLSLLKNNIIPATGCTEPIAVAYAVARAREEATSKKLFNIQVQVDSNIYKNSLMVTIPGTKERGLLAAAAFGFLVGNSKKRLRVIENLSSEDIQNAHKIMAQDKIQVILNREYKGLHIEVILVTDLEKVRVIILDSHLNIVSVEKIPKENNFQPFVGESRRQDNKNNKIQYYDLEKLLQFSIQVPTKDLQFLEEGVRMNLAIAKEGLNIKSGVGATLIKMIKEGLLSDNLVTRAQVLCAAASEARMTGSALPVMSTAGSGNHGITVFLTNYAVAEIQQFPQEKLLRSLALTNLITFFIKTYTGTLIFVLASFYSNCAPTYTLNLVAPEPLWGDTAIAIQAFKSGLEYLTDGDIYVIGCL